MSFPILTVWVLDCIVTEDTGQIVAQYVSVIYACSQDFGGW